jgi:hypothetical protein
MPQQKRRRPMTKEHCDRCDVWLGEGEGHWPNANHQLKSTFLADKGAVLDNHRPLLIGVKVTQGDEEGGYHDVTLCDECLNDAIDAFAHYRLTLREAQRKAVHQ